MLFFSEVGAEGRRVMQGCDDGGGNRFCGTLVWRVDVVGFLELGRGCA